MIICTVSLEIVIMMTIIGRGLILHHMIVLTIEGSYLLIVNSELRKKKTRRKPEFTNLHRSGSEIDVIADGGGVHCYLLKLRV